MLALGLALPVVGLQAQDSTTERPNREGRGQGGDRPMPGLFGALDANSVALLDNNEAFAGLDAMHFPRLPHHAFGADQNAGHGPAAGEGNERGDDRSPADASLAAQQDDGSVDQARDNDAGGDCEQLVAEHGHRVGAEEGAGNNGQRV